MPRKPKPASTRLLEGRSEGRDSGGRLVAPPGRPVFVPPPMPAGLPTAVRREWRRVVKELEDGGSPMPAPAVLADYCRTLVRQHQVAAALENEPAGTTTWRRLITTETELANRITEFCATFFAPAPDVDDDADGGHNPFAGAAADGGAPSQIKCLSPWMRGSRYAENPVPPADPRYRKVWEQAMAISAENHPDDPVYSPFRFRRGDHDDE
jgi:hypothetical protein